MFVKFWAKEIAWKSVTTPHMAILSFLVSEELPEEGSEKVVKV